MRPSSKPPRRTDYDLQRDWLFRGSSLELREIHVSQAMAHSFDALTLLRKRGISHLES